ncbi:hypothetical protein MNBD_GAMMA16-1379 [hydrothermal vent metagenome]|uniref:Zinc finger CHCC-type domain-containing protein n=1 Tax=hydrothermal vent metagenome TaxID=652676 RepID=A0A3B0Z877_9ZZZZ
MSQNNSNQEILTPSPSLKSVPIKVSSADLPLHCPTAASPLWSSHPHVYLPIEESGIAKCPYCGAEYELTKE